MKTIVLKPRDSFDKPEILFQTLPSGDIELVTSKLVGGSAGFGWKGERTGQEGGMFDEQICSIPKSKVPELITFLQSIK